MNTNNESKSTLNIGIQISALKRMTVADLRKRHLEAFGEPNPSSNKTYLIKRIAWRLQSQAFGGLSEHARRRAEELARDSDIRTTAPRTNNANKIPNTEIMAEGTIPLVTDPRLPQPGSILTRVYKGEHIDVVVLANGFEYEGKRYKSLSAAARAITGSHVNGFAFFGLSKEDAKQ